VLSNGKVLIAGGYNGVSYLAFAEVYDSAAGTFSATGSLANARESYTATLLPNGKVLIAGGLNGVSLASAELYDPATGAFSATGSLVAARFRHTATLLTNGKVLIAGGHDDSSMSPRPSCTTPPRGPSAHGRSPCHTAYLHTATLLANGKVLIAGGASDVPTVASAELYDLTTAPSAPRAISPAGVIRRLCCRTGVLMAGGYNSYQSLGWLTTRPRYLGATGSLTTGRYTRRRCCRTERC
jgi:hypothetical protein